MSDEEIATIFNTTGMNAIAPQNFDSAASVSYSYVHPAVDFMMQLNAPTLLPSLNAMLKSRLQTFLQPAAKLLVRYQARNISERDQDCHMLTRRVPILFLPFRTMRSWSTKRVVTAGPRKISIAAYQ